MIKALKENSDVYKKLEDLNNYLLENNIALVATPQNGILYHYGDSYYKHTQGGDYYVEAIPPHFDGKYILCDEHGNTDFYND